MAARPTFKRACAGHANHGHLFLSMESFGRALSLRIDGAIGAMSVSPNGRDAVLAGRRGLFIIDLDDPFTTPRWLRHITLWEVADVQWSPHGAARPSWCISTSNQKALLWDLLRPSNNAIVQVLHKHTRAITDINFHPQHPDMLATCAIDTFVYGWDMRCPRRPVHQWAEWRAGATQVKWSRDNPHQIALAHDNVLYLWDTRRGALPVVKVARAHRGKINGVDFGRLLNVITCSNDRTVKMWDLGRHDGDSDVSPSVVLAFDFAVSRARAVPFGEDKACGVMPTRGGGDAIHIINYERQFRQAEALGEAVAVAAQPVYSFKGHEGSIKDFLWRPGAADARQLVTWSSQDYDLKLWPHDDELYRAVNAPVCPARGAPVVALYCVEPPVTFDNVASTDDLLSRATMFKILQRSSQQGVRHDVALNHLDWISGVRMGQAIAGAGASSAAASGANGESLSGPSNLGEEVSYVGHKFPKVRFEKISVLTGELIISLRGPITADAAAAEDMAPSGTLPAAAGTAGTASSGGGDDNLGGENELTKDGSEVGEDAADTVVSPAVAPSHISDAPGDEADSKLVFIRMEIKLPKLYPHLEEVGTTRPLKVQRQNVIQFDIEETHELSAQAKLHMLDTLNQIARFYTNKHQRFCLEPCLRFLMGDKIDLQDLLLVAAEDAEVEVGTEGWADDLINQQPETGYNGADGDDVGEDEDDYLDLIPAAGDDGQGGDGDALPEAGSRMIGPVFDSTPVPKGCGAVWSPTGQLVCFFIPQGDVAESAEPKALQKFNIFKFTDGHASGLDDEISSLGVSLGSEESEASGDTSGSDSDSNSDTSEDSFTNDWDDVLQGDMPSRTRIPGLFKTSVGLGNRYVARGSGTGSGGGGGGGSAGLGHNGVLGHGSSKLSRLYSNGGSNRHSSLGGSRRRKRKGGKDGNNKVVIYDMRHMLPDKYELACNYRVLGDAPQALAAYNAEVALRNGLHEIADVWRILEMILTKDVELIAPPPLLLKMTRSTPQHSEWYRFFWGTHPFGFTWLVRRIFDHFEARGNIQMLAMLACILYENPTNVHRDTVPIHTPYGAMPPPVLPVASAAAAAASSANGGATAVAATAGSIAAGPPGAISAYSGTPFGNGLSDDGLGPHYSLKNWSGSLIARVAGVARLVASSFDGSVDGALPDRRLPEPKPWSDMQLLPLLVVQPQLRRGITMDARKAFKTARARHPPAVTVEMCNLAELDLFDDSYTQPLLAGVSADRLQRYRAHYADMLYLWGLPVSRIKILKFNYSEVERRAQLPFEVHRAAFGRRERAPRVAAKTAATVWRDGNALQRCNLCQLPITKTLVVCVNCEHILHTHCAHEWWPHKEGNLEMIECPSGCGCQCLRHV